jgi:5-formyltetrahydrofolate cyclo-ligase
MLEELLHFNVDDSPFLHHRGISLTRKNFIDKVYQYRSLLKSWDMEDVYIYLHVESPLEFYAILLASWSLEKKVTFPTKQTIEEHSIPDYCKYILSFSENSLHIKENEFYQEVN